MNVLVTGGNGQLGSEVKFITKLLPELEFQFHDIDTLNLLDEKLLSEYFNENKPDFVINCAAYTAVDKAEEDKEEAHKGNVVAVKNLINECLRFNTYFIHISSDYVFDGHNYKPYTEDDKVNPVSEYGKSKLLGEQEALKYNKSVVLRTSWLYSSYGNNFVKTMIRLGNEKESLGVKVDEVGTPTYAADLAWAIIHIISITVKEKKSFIPGIYHYSNEGVCSWFDFTKAIHEIKGIQCNVFPIETKDFPLPAKRPQYSVLNKSKIKKTFGLEIPYWRDSLIKCLKKIQ